MAHSVLGCLRIVAVTEMMISLLSFHKANAVDDSLALQETSSFLGNALVRNLLASALRTRSLVVVSQFLAYLRLRRSLQSAHMV